MTRRRPVRKNVIGAITGSSNVNITKQELITAANGVISAEQAEAVWAALEKNTAHRPRFELAHVAYYFGALIVIGAMGWFMGLAWENFGGSGILVLAVAYALLFVMAGRTLWKTPSLRIPGGLFITMAVCMTPLAIYGLERMTNFWPQDDPGSYANFHPYINASWIFMELGTIIAAFVALRFFPFTFLTAPIAYALWYLSMDVVPLLLGEAWTTWEQRLWISLWCGVIMLLIAYLIDRRTRQDFAFWLYLFGMAAFWGSMSSMDGGSEYRKAIYCVINLGLIVLSVLLQRRVFIVCGALGVMGYLGHLSYSVFRDSIMFPFALTIIGVAVIALGVFWQKNRASIEAGIMRLVPEPIRKQLPSARIGN